MNKKGIEFMGSHVVNILIGVIVGFLLMLLIYGLYTIFSDENSLKKAEAELDKIALVVDDVQESGDEKSATIFPPNSWVLRTFPKSDFPIGECRGAVDCLCICKDVNCESEKVCKGFSFEVEVDDSYEKSGGMVPFGGAVSTSSYENAIELEEVEELKISKEDGVIKIRRNKDE